MKKNKKSILIKFSILGLFLVGSVIQSVISNKNSKAYNKDYFENFNESFEGEIVNVINVKGSHRCLIEIELTKSSTDFYDIRGSTNMYYVVIKGNKAEVISDIRYLDYPENGNRIKKGQYLKFDGQVDSTFLYQKNILIDKWKPYLYDFRNFIIKEKHKIE